MFDIKDSVAIIMPNYNKGKFINKAIQSVLNQTYNNWKLYIVDDNSNDNSIKILKKIKKKKIKIFYLKQNKGPSYCRNLILKKAKSKYIAFLDSDDFWLKKQTKVSDKFYEKKNILLLLQITFQ